MIRRSSVDLPHRTLQAFREHLKSLAELCVAVDLPAREPGLSLRPEHRERYTLTAQFLMNAPMV
jgi:hypothetical protein